MTGPRVSRVSRTEYDYKKVWRIKKKSKGKTKYLLTDYLLNKVIWKMLFHLSIIITFKSTGRNNKHLTKIKWRECGDENSTPGGGRFGRSVCYTIETNGRRRWAFSHVQNNCFVFPLCCSFLVYIECFFLPSFLAILRTLFVSITSFRL